MRETAFLHGELESAGEDEDDLSHCGWFPGKPGRPLLHPQSVSSPNGRLSVCVWAGLRYRTRYRRPCADS